jgi:virginiamycin B lyase
MVELARMDVPSAAWFAVASGAIWVTSEAGVGISRIDPSTNSVTAHLGDVRPCGAPAMALGDLWLSSCASDVFLRIDPTTNSIVSTIPAQGHGRLVAVGDTLVTLGPDGLAVLDPLSRTFAPLPGSPGIGARALASDGSAVWALLATSVVRVDLHSGATLATFPYQATEFLTAAGGHAWLTAPSGAVEIDLTSNVVTRTIPGVTSPNVAREGDGFLWVTDLDNSDLWRIEL